MTPGFKSSEAGAIPLDWEVRRLDEVVHFLDGQRRPVKDTDRAKMRGDQTCRIRGRIEPLEDEL